MIDNLKTFYHRRPWSGRFIAVLFILSMLLIGARIALSPGIIYGTTAWLKKQGIDASIEAVDINIFDGTVTLKNAVGNKSRKPLFKIGLVDLHWQWQPLSNRTIKITSVALDSLDINIKQYSDAIIIGGINISLGKTTNKAPDSTEKNLSNAGINAWAASLGEINFTNLNICYQQNTATLALATDKSIFIDYCVALKKMSWAGTISYATDTELLKTGDVPLTSTGDFTLDGLSIIDNRLNKKLLSSKANTLNNVSVRGLNDIHIEQLIMSELSLLQRDDKKHIDALRFQQLTVNDIKFSRLNSLSINDVSVSGPGVYLVKLNSSDWEYQQWIPQSPDNNQTIKEASKEKPVEESAAFKFTLNNLNISNSDLCYLDNSSSLYYCLTIAALDWKGSLRYNSDASKVDTLNLQAEGNLTLLQPNIRNHSINRDLLDFKKLALTKLKVSGNSISIDKIKLNELTALQRSKQNNDYTLSFDNLAIDNIKYDSNKLTINTITLKGLSSAISKNKDGHWEYDKWLANNNTKTAEDNNDTKKQKPAVVSLNELNITTDKKIIFTDNSSQPAMKIGLSELAFDVKKIATDKPDTNSSFKFFAKTTRHGTIDIEGTAKPFAKKISFDATGKLKGFDLRAATPATKKSIGHIIQSGQLDADLKLLAVDGVLDSNIALTLYQFNIKAINKESAKKLDAKFGMPLNQTLVLLRDKDDSIHLDIPITGDVTNPNFNPMDAIIKATSKAATVTLITFYTPYGLIYAGGNLAFNLATALNFDPIEFTPGSTKISDNAKQQLDGLTKLLSEKPQVHLALCGVTNKQDTFALFPALKEKFANKITKGEDNTTEIKLTDEQLLQLNQLARDRQINSKNYLVKQRGIEHDRLILCAPEHKNNDDAIAGVKIEI